jgi:YidC/Oxa1 family membrane protein insertase
LALVPYVLLVLFFGLSVWLPQFLMPGDKQQKMMAGYMAVMMLGFGWFAPAGVLLYWDVSSLWQVAQQQVTMAVVKNEHEASPDISKEPTVVAEVSEKKPSNKGGKSKKKS